MMKIQVMITDDDHDSMIGAGPGPGLLSSSGRDIRFISHGAPAVPSGLGACRQCGDKLKLKRPGPRPGPAGLGRP